MTEQQSNDIVLDNLLKQLHCVSCQLLCYHQMIYNICFTP